MSILSVLTQIAWEWGERCFGEKHMEDEEARGERMVEEAIEVCQCLGISRKTTHRIVDMVYDKKVGEINRELGGLVLTTAVLCQTLSTDIETVYINEILRVLAKEPAHFAKRNQEKIQLIHGAENA